MDYKPKHQPPNELAVTPNHSVTKSVAVTPTKCTFQVIARPTIGFAVLRTDMETGSSTIVALEKTKAKAVRRADIEAENWKMMRQRIANQKRLPTY